MVMASIWLTAAAEAEFKRLQAVAPSQADAVSGAINDIPDNPGNPGRRLNLPGAPPAEPFLAVEPRDPDAPAVIYRRTTPEEDGDWLVVSLMSQDDYRAARRAEIALAAAPPAVRELVNAVVTGTVATVTARAVPGTVNTGAVNPTSQADGGDSATGANMPPRPG